MTELESASFAGLPLPISPAIEPGEVFEPKWHHITATLLDLPPDERAEYERKLVAIEGTDPRISDVLDVLSGHYRLTPTQQIIHHSVLTRTDAALGGYVRPGDIAEDLDATGFQFDFLRSKTDHLIPPTEAIVARNLLSERGIGRAYRLINPVNARMMRERAVVLPEEMISAPEALQLAYGAFRLVVPHSDGSGFVRKSEVASALHANNSMDLGRLADQVLSRIGRIAGDGATTESLARVTIERLSEHPIFQVSSLRYGPDRFIKLTASQLPARP